MDWNTQITITNPRSGLTLTLPLGKNYAYRRVPGSVTISIGGVCGTNVTGCPIAVEFDVCPDGSLQLRSVLPGHDNGFAHLVIADAPPTSAQIATIKSKPYGAASGRSLMAWAEGDAAVKIAEAYHS